MTLEWKKIIDEVPTRNDQRDVLVLSRDHHYWINYYNTWEDMNQMGYHILFWCYLPIPIDVFEEVAGRVAP